MHIINGIKLLPFYDTAHVNVLFAFFESDPFGIQLYRRRWIVTLPWEFTLIRRGWINEFYMYRFLAFRSNKCDNKTLEVLPRYMRHLCHCLIEQLKPTISNVWVFALKRPEANISVILHLFHYPVK